MSIGPILPGRLPNSLLNSRLTENIQTATRLMARLQDQVATGQKFFTISEAPTAAVKTIVLQKTLEQQQQYEANIQTDQSFLSASESALATVSDAFNSAKSLLLEAVGDTVTSEEKQAIAEEVRSLIRQTLNAANTTFRGRYLFGGSESQQIPFEFADAGGIRYNGDRYAIDSFADSGLLIANNVDGDAAFNAFSAPVGSDINPALTLDTKISQLNGGNGVGLGQISVTVVDGGTQNQVIDLAGAETIRDIKTRIEAAFPSGPPGNVVVDIDTSSPTNFAIRLTQPNGGTVQAADLPNLTVAADLGIVGGPAAVINGSDLNPTLTLQTPLSELNGGNGITGTDGLVIVNGSKSATVDISTAVTVEDLFNILEAADLDLELRINDAGDGLAISSRLNGVNFSIGENGGTDATDLGIRTFLAGTPLSDLNLGLGVPVDQFENLDITLSDGTALSIDLSAANTVQDVLNIITAADADLTATLNAVGNGITLTDVSAGAGNFIVPSNIVSDALGIAATVATGNPIIGTEINPLQATGVLSLLVQLESAVRAEDDGELQRLADLLEVEEGRFNLVRSELGSRLQLLETVQNRLLDREIQTQFDLSHEFDADLTEVVTQIAFTQQTLEATLRIAADTLQLSLLNFI